MKKIITILVSVIFLSSSVFANMIVFDESDSKIGYNVEINLYKGWNLIPAICNSGINDIKIAKIQTMFVLDSVTKEYINVYHNGKFRNENVISDNEESLCSSSWWVYVTQSNIFKYKTDYLLKLKDLRLKSGWNLLIVTPEFEDKSLDKLKGTCDISKSYFYNAEEQETEEGTNWKKVPLNMNIPNDLVGLNLVLKVKSNCELSDSSSETIIPPPLPDTSIIEPSTKCVKIFNSGDSSDKVDIVFVPDRYIDSDLWDSDVSFFSDIEGISDGFFSLEPIKSYKNRFNIWKVNKLGLEFWQIEVGQGQSLSGESREELDKLAKECADYDFIFLIKDNSDGTIIPAAWAPGETMIFTTRLDDFDKLRTRTLLHEFGHAFADLGDEYYTGRSTTDYSHRSNIDTEGCPKWCSGELNQDAVCYEDYILFRDCLYDVTNNLKTNYGGQCQDLYNIDSTCSLGLNCRVGTGCYWNAKSLISFKSSPKSIMNHQDEDPFEFNLISREAIQKNINSLSNP